jgi:hypothetical protein
MPGFAINNTSGAISIDPKAEFHRVHRWYINNLGIPASIVGSDNSSKFRLYAHSLELPSISFEEELVNGASLKYKFPKRVLWDPVTVSFYDVFGIHKKFEKWRQAIWTPEEGIKLANDFKGEAEFILTNGKGEDKQFYTLIGCYPSKISHSELTYTSSDIKLLRVTYSFDYAKIEIIDASTREPVQQQANTLTSVAPIPADASFAQ